MEIVSLTLRQAISSLQAGELSSEDLTRAYLQRIQKLDSHLHAFLEVGEASAIQEARAADALRKETHSRGESAASLLGIPLAIKDVLCVKGMHCTCGSRILEGYKPPFEATAVQKLRAQGAIFLGKTNTDEFAMGSSTENSAFGATRNPWNTKRVPGGSSGGSAAAVSADLAVAALGTDTGGSVRQPASYCGVTGLKPSYGRVSRYGLVAFGSSLDCVGVLAASAEDVAIVLETMAGKDPRDATSIAAPIPAYQAGMCGEPTLRGLRIGVPTQFFMDGIQPDVEKAVRIAIRQLETLGAEIREVQLPNAQYALPVYYLVAPAEASANLARYDGVRFGKRSNATSLWESYDRTRGEGFGPEVKRRIMLGTYALSAGYYDAYYGQAQKVRTMIKTDFDSAFQTVDIIACPVAPHTAFALGEKSDDPLSMYLEDIFTLPASLAGVPAISLPCGFDADGLPIGLQLNGPFLGEEALLRTGWAYQQVTQWHQEKPSL
jgi:aspartyl-tRNA(Asn)/glutamyl-tRNA(Gln) amidotransferase subunit A